MFDRINELFRSRQEEPSYKEKVRSDLDNEAVIFQSVLDHYLPKDTFHPQKVLDICCGLAAEEESLKKQFNLADSAIISIDKDLDLVDFARELGRNTVRQGNILDPSGLSDLGIVDLIIGRNVPLNPSSGDTIDRDWLAGFVRLVEHLSDGGSLLITVLREDEFEAAKKILSEVGLDLEKTEKNTVTVPSKVVGVSSQTKDNFVLVARKPATPSPLVH